MVEKGLSCRLEESNHGITAGQGRGFDKQSPFHLMAAFCRPPWPLLNFCRLLSIPQHG